jgi:hypothetical protein
MAVRRHPPHRFSVYRYHFPPYVLFDVLDLVHKARFQQFAPYRAQHPPVYVVPGYPSSKVRNLQIHFFRMTP